MKNKLKHNKLISLMRDNKRIRYAVIGSLVFFLLLIALLLYSSQKNQEKYDVNSSSDGSSYTVQYKGKEYEYNNSISNILIIGIDSTGKMKTSKTYGVDARADNIDLISFDRENNVIKILPISRDTMTDIMRYSSKGYELGYYKDHLGFAYSYGNGGRESSMNVCDAVSKLLYGVPVYRFVTTNIDSIGYANSLVGGVTVTCPNSDLADRYPDFYEGNKVTLTDDNVEAFLRSRANDVGSNNGRMERQQAFLEAFIKKLQTMDTEEYEEMWDKLKAKDSPIQTNISESMFMNIIANTKDYTYKPKRDNLKIIGTDKVEDERDVFYPDIDKLKELVVKTYFEPI